MDLDLDHVKKIHNVCESGSQIDSSMLRKRLNC